MQPPSSTDDLVNRSVRRRRNRLRLMVVGLLTVFAGLYLLAIPPDTGYDQVIWRVVLGFALLLGGALMAVLPVVMDAVGLGNE